MSLPDGDELVLLHNPKCSKSRAALALLEERGTVFEQRLYLEDPLTRAELEDLASRLGRPVGEWTRKKAAAEVGLSPDSEPGALYDGMAKAPALLERPILVSGRKAIVGRPPEDILGLL